MDAQALTGYIQQGIRQELTADGLRLYLPFFFGEGTHAPLCLYWDKNGVLHDGGRTVAELKNRAGDYRARIRNVLKNHDRVTLEGGQKLVVRHFQTCNPGPRQYLDYMGGLSRLLRVIALLTMPDFATVEEDGTVRLC